MDSFHEQFAREYRFRHQEYKRLEQLWHDVLWYNFETVAYHWNQPWPQSIDSSTLELHAQRYMLVTSRCGRMCEKAEYPLYFGGPVADAPTLPPEIVLHELKVAWDDAERAKDQCSAPYDWAPGGILYEKMLRESPGVQAYKTLSSK